MSERKIGKPLRAKLFSGGVLVLASVVLILMLFLPFISLELDQQIQSLDDDLQHNILDEAITLARMLVFEFSRLQDVNDLMYVQMTAEELEDRTIPIRNFLWEKVTFNSIIQNIQLLDDSGSVHLLPFGQDQVDEAADDYIRNFLGISSMAYLPGSDVVHVIMPLYIEGNRWGVVKVSVSTKEIQAQLNDQIKRQSNFRQLTLILFVAALVFSTLVGAFVLSLMARRVTNPLNALARNAEIFAALGDARQLEQIVAEDDEIGLLADNFQQMAADINRLLVEKDEAFGELKKSQEQLRQSEKLATLGQLSGGIAHEINNALSPIRLRGEEVVMTLEEGGQAEIDDLQVILRGIDKCTNIVQKLRDFAVPSLGEKSALNLNLLIEDTAALVGSQLAKTGVKLEMELCEAAPVIGSAGELEQVLMNMILNARDAIEAGNGGEGSICLATTIVAGKTRLSISDNGIGMAEETKSRIFEPFFTTKAIGKGTGLGLSVSFGILQSHGASLAVDSEQKKGTKITITFPAGDEA